MQIGGEFQVELELFPVVNRITNKIKKKKSVLGRKFNQAKL